MPDLIRHPEGLEFVGEKDQLHPLGYIAKSVITY